MIQRIGAMAAAGFIACILIFSCKNESIEEINSAPVGHYPENINKIIVTRCAVAGCHNALSYKNAGGLQLDTWEHMFNGGSTGAAVIPYSVDNSSLLYFINTHADLGPVAEPTMPLNGTPLSQDE